MSLDDDARAQLVRLAAEHRLREPRVVDGAQGPRIRLDGASVLNLAANDYLGLAADPRLARAAAASAEEVGLGAGASRLIVGNHREHVLLEQAVADWMRCDGVRVFATGFAANVGVLTSLVGPGDTVFSDELNHASLVDGCRLCRAEVVIVPHLDVDALARELARPRGGRRVVVTETLFSMDGDLADVAVLVELCRRYDAALVLDEAHAVGARGPEGWGVAAEAGQVPDVLVGTFGKALGGAGAFVATTRAIADLLWNRARSFVFSTAPPAMLATAMRRSIEIVRGAEGDDRRRTLAARARELRAVVAQAGEVPTRRSLRFRSETTLA